MTSLAYATPQAWADGPDHVYRALARAAVGRLPQPLAGRLALDAGTGTGAVARALAARGARVVALDASPAMMRYAAPARPPGTVGDICALPLRTAAVDVAVAGFVLSHLDQPAYGIAELARVVRPGGLVAVTSFPAGSDRSSHPVKTAVDGVLDRLGYTPPPWYAELKGPGEQRVGTAAGLYALTLDTGLADVHVEEVCVDLASLGAAGLAAWRLGMGHVAPWLSTVDSSARPAVVEAAAAAVSRVPAAPLPMLLAYGFAPGGHPRAWSPSSVGRGSPASHSYR